jgi:hypothetical protein
VCKQIGTGWYTADSHQGVSWSQEHSDDSSVCPFVPCPATGSNQRFGGSLMEIHFHKDDKDCFSTAITPKKEDKVISDEDAKRIIHIILGLGDEGGEENEQD